MEPAAAINEDEGARRIVNRAVEISVQRRCTLAVATRHAQREAQASSADESEAALVANRAADFQRKYPRLSLAGCWALAMQNARQ